MLHQSYNVVANHSVDLSVLNEITSQATHSWVPFSLLEMQKVLKAYSNISALGPDYITWWYLKYILSNNSCAVGILFLADVCLSLHHCIFWTGGLVYNTYLVQASWAKGLKTSIIAFDIAQFFPSLNHSMLTSILSHFGFANCIVDFFSNYLVGRFTQYSWNSFLSGACDADVGIGQESALSSILSALYIAPHRAQALNLDTCILSFVDNDLLISQEKTYNKIFPDLYSSYRVVTNLMVMFSLVMEHDKLEIFHFSRMYNDLNLELNLSAIGTPTLKPKIYWRYLGFYFD